jgi:hypothetical protein
MIASSGSPGSSTITITPAGGFTGQINLTCAEASAPTGAANDATCSLGTQSTVTVSGASAVTATMTITTTSASAALQKSKPGTLIPAAAGAVLAAMLLWIPAKRRYRFTAMSLLLLAVGSIIATGCGGGSHATPTGPSGAGTYAFTVTGKDVATGLIVSSATVTVTVE